MAISPNTSMDMATLDVNEEGNNTPYLNSETPGSQQFGELYTAHSEPFFISTAPGNQSSMNDVNDISLSDITDTLSDAAKSVADTVSETASSVYDKGKETLEDVGIISKSPKSESLKPKTKVVVENEKQPERVGSDGVKALQTYFSSPSPILASFIGSDKYDGEIDGKPGNKTNRIADKIESSLAKLLGTNAIYGLVLRTTPDDIEKALRQAADYREFKREEKKASIMSKDDRMYELSKIMIKR